jgi:glycosyltransferase involved in cell wall biosynthesis
LFKFDIIHCRSYWPTISIEKFHESIVFDLRSLWVSENLSSGDLIENSLAHKYWNQIEIKCLQNSKISTCVSSGMVEYCKMLVPNINVELIPISVNPLYFSFDLSSRSRIREFLNWNSNTIFVYSGSFGQSGINIEALKQTFNFILSIDKSYRLLILTNDKSSFLNEILASLPLFKNCVKVFHPKFDDISSWLSASDIGLHALPFQQDSFSRLGTKVVEYWMNGLPVVINSNIGEAVKYVENLGYGLVLDDKKMKLETSLIKSNMVSLLKIKRKSISSFALDNFSVDIIANKYLKTYKEIYFKNKK